MSIEKIKQLRDQTQAPVQDCKEALQECGGDIDEAKEILKKRGLETAAQKKERTTKAGVVGVYEHTNKKIAALVQVFCETDFVARNKEFQKLADQLAMQVAGLDPEHKEDLLSRPYIKDESITTEELIKQNISKLGENIELGEFVRLEI